VAHSSEPSNHSLTQLALGALGGALLGSDPEHPAARRLLRGAGVALVAYAARPWIERAILNAGDRRRRVALRSSVEIDRPLLSVFAFFKDFENLPRVIGSVRSITDYQDGRSHWEAYTPAGESIEWDVVVTKYVPNSVIGFESVPGSPVDVRAQFRFTRISTMRTRLDVETYFSPHTTGLGDAIRALLSPANERRLLGDLDHMRFYLESVLPLEPESQMESAEGDEPAAITRPDPRHHDPSLDEPTGARRSE